MFQKKISSSEAENEKVRNRYAAFVQQHGELFEDKTEPLSPDDIQDFKKRRLKVKRWWIVISLVVGILALPSFFDSSNFQSKADSLIVLVIAVGGGALLVWHFTKALKSNEKRVLQGVVTAKARINKFFDSDNNGYYLELSGKQKLRVVSGDYKICELGEIIRIEMLTDDILIKRKITKLGKI